MLHGNHGTATSLPDDYHLPGLGIHLRRGQSRRFRNTANAVYRTALYIAVGYFVAFLRIVEGHMPEVIFISLAMGSVHFALFYGGMSLADNVSAVAVATQLGVPFATIMSIVF